MSGDRRLRGGLRRDAAPLVLAAAWYLAFIARTAVVSGGRLHFPLVDDAMISMRYAHQLAGGHGLSWNPGGPAVEGYSNLLWTAWMAALHVLGLSGDAVSLLVMLSGMALLLANVVLVRRIARCIAPGSDLVVQLSTWGAALCYPLVYWTLRGLEPGLIALLLSASVLTALRAVEKVSAGNVAALAALLALSVLARDDMLIAAAVVLGFVAVRSHGRLRLVAAGLPLLVVAATFGVHVLVRQAVYGDPLPATYYDKLAGIPLALRLHTGNSWLVPTVVVPLLVPLLGAFAYLLLRGRTAAPASLMLLAVWLLTCAYSVYVGGDAWEFSGYANRFIAPAIPLLLVVSAMGFDALVTADAQTRRRALAGLALASAGTTVAVAVEAAFAVPQAVAQAQMQPGSLATVSGLVAVACVVVWGAGARRNLLLRGAALLGAAAVAGSEAVPVIGCARSNALLFSCDVARQRLGEAIGEATGGHATIAAAAAGAIPYWAGGTAVDLLGLSDARVAHEDPHPGPLRPGHMKWDLAYSIGELRPDVVATLPQTTPAVEAQLVAWGYVHSSATVWIRSDSTYAAALQRSAVPADQGGADADC